MAISCVISSLGLFAISGCSGNTVTPITVSGAVTLDDQPLKVAVLNLLNTKTGEAVTAQITDGKFQISAPIHPGNYNATITPLKPASPFDKPLPEAEQVKIPGIYQDSATSPLRAEVAERISPLDFKLSSAGPGNQKR